MIRTFKMPSWSSGCFGAMKKDGEGFYSKGNSDISRVEDEPIISENKKGTSVVELKKKEGETLGLIISGGVDKNSRPKIANLRPGSIAHSNDALAVGDYIISVNGIRTCKLKHEEIVNLLKNAGNKVMLEIEYEIPDTNNTSHLTTAKIIQVKLEKENDSYGFTLRGGTCVDRMKSRPLTITHVKVGGPASRTGIIKAGDRLLAVDGIKLVTASLPEALKVLDNLKQSALFTIEYNVSIIEAVKNAKGPLLVQIDKTPNCILGISLSSVSTPNYSIVIDSIRQASIAERCGALHVGDHILAVDDIKVDMMTASEVMQLLKSTKSGTVTLEVLPISQMALRINVPEQSKKGGMSIDAYGYISSGYGVGSRKACGGMVGNCFHNSLAHSSSDGSLASLSKSNCTAVGRADRTEVVLVPDCKGFGFMLQGTLYSSETLTVPPYISGIDQGSPAERCGLLQVGDRILAINGESTESLTLEEVTSLITHSHPRLHMIIEFDVAEAVVPSSGTFVVKLIKRGEDLGINVTASRNRKFGEPVIIADVKKGSVAHRTGSIQPGDKLLAVNNLRTENCTVEDVTEFLHSFNDIVKLRIRKDDTFSEDPDSTCTTVYTVELVRHGGPLGITVSGTQEPFDPIFISCLTENGLAERTGALHVGDRILAVNGNSLRGKTLNEAICILQTCGDKVTLKIARCPYPEKSDSDEPNGKCIHCIPESQLKTFSTPLPSVDSAVDSWDSCNPGTSTYPTRIKNGFYGHSASDGNISVLYQYDCESANQANKYPADNSWEHKTARSNSFSGSILSDEEKENWHKVLEDLETCGQSQLLRQIEKSILGIDENANESKCDSERNFQTQNTSPEGTLSENNLQELNSQFELLSTDIIEQNERTNGCYSKLTSKRHQDLANRHSICNGSRDAYGLPSVQYMVPLPVEIHKVTLFKDQVYEDFGFSLSDGKYENGVFINSIRPGGPADISGLIKPLDRILQVNNVKTYNAGLIVPLIASSGDRLELVISRPAYNREYSSDSTLGKGSHFHPWVESEIDKERSLSPFPPDSQTHTLTKTL